MRLDLGDREPLTVSSFFTVFLPPVLLYYVTNVLAILGPRTFATRVALLPVTLFMAYRATFSLDVAKGLLPSNPDQLGYFNQTLVLAMFTVTTRSLVRTFSSQIPARRDVAGLDLPQLLLEACDLTFGLRGIGWNFSATLKLPPYKRPLAPSSAFLRATARSLVVHIVAFDFLHYACQLISPEPLGSTAGFSIFDARIADPYYAVATVQSILVGLCIYGAVHIGHDAFSLIGVGVLRQPPAAWPPVFDTPWFATSLTEFWAARWHQVFRGEFIALGSKPLARVAGRPGAVVGAFLVSGLLHYVGLWGLAKGSDARVILFFLMMGVGVVLEGLWRQVSGSRVGGSLGWIWTVLWVVGFSPLMTDPWVRSGIMGSVFLPNPVRPSILLHRLILGALHYGKVL